VPQSAPTPQFHTSPPIHIPFRTYSPLSIYLRW
jgi:hypothetical protein